MTPVTKEKRLGNTLMKCDADGNAKALINMGRRAKKFYLKEIGILVMPWIEKVKLSFSVKSGTK